MVLAEQPPVRVFISHSSEDAALASQLCAGLEGAGVRCWIAPRDIPLGADFGVEILKAIKAVEAVVILLTPASMASTDVAAEVEFARDQKKKLMSIHLDDAELSGQLEYFLRLPQRVWLSQCGLDGVVAAVSTQLNVVGVTTEQPVLTSPVETTTLSVPKRDDVKPDTTKPDTIKPNLSGLLWVAIAVGVAVCFWGGWTLLSEGEPIETAAAASSTAVQGAISSAIDEPRKDDEAEQESTARPTETTTASVTPTQSVTPHKPGGGGKPEPIRPGATGAATAAPTPTDSASTTVDPASLRACNAAALERIKRKVSENQDKTLAVTGSVTVRTGANGKLEFDGPAQLTEGLTRFAGLCTVSTPLTIP